MDPQRPTQDDKADRRIDSHDLLGQLLIAHRYATPEQLEEALQEQADLTRKGRRIPLGQVLLARGAISQAQFLEVIKMQARFLLKCESCDIKYNILQFREGRKFRCARCGRVLVVPTLSESLVGE
jgi:hypothetical protein